MKSLADSTSPTRAAKSSAVLPPCGTICWLAGSLCGGTAMTWLQVSERAPTSAPCESSTLIA